MHTCGAVMQVPVIRSGLVGWCRLCDEALTSTVRTKSVGCVDARIRTVLLRLRTASSTSGDRVHTQSAPATWRRSEMSGTIGPRPWGQWRRRALAVGLCLVLPVRAAAAPKTDTVVLTNGDRLTCEIKKLH